MRNKEALTGRTPENAKKVVDANKGYYAFNSKGQVIYPVETPRPSYQLGEVTSSVLNVRKCASLYGAVIGQLKKGYKVKIESIVGDWYSIYYGNHGVLYIRII